MGGRGSIWENTFWKLRNGRRPPTAKGFVFSAMEDEDGLKNVIVKPDVFQRCYMLLRTDF